MRHNRSDAFRHAIEDGPQHPRAARWTDLDDDPNAPRTIVFRASVLARAWRDPVEDRSAFLEQRCRARTVLDIGCVAHDVDRSAADNWLHARLAAVASICRGVDVLSSQIAELNQRGFQIVDHDLATGLGPLAADAPYDVIVAGELIEHVADLGMLFRTAAAALSDDGELIITTPNPYTPERVRAGQLGIIWENVDHIVYAFPSGVAELAERHGLVLTEAMTTTAPPRRSTGVSLRNWYQLIRGSRFLSVGISTLEPARERRVRFGKLASVWHGTWWPRRQFTGETFIYVVRRERHYGSPADDTGARDGGKA